MNTKIDVFIIWIKKHITIFIVWTIIGIIIGLTYGAKLTNQRMDEGVMLGGIIHRGKAYVLKFTPPANPTNNNTTSDNTTKVTK